MREQLTERATVSGAATRSQLLADLGTSSWADSSQETIKRVLPNRTGVRENERSVDRVSKLKSFKVIKFQSYKVSTL